MDDVKAVRHILANNATLTAQVPAARIIVGVLPQATAPPAIAVTHVSTVRPQMVAAPSRMCVSRVQVTVMASSYTTQKSIMALVRAALPRSRGTFNGVGVDSIIPDAEGPDFTDEAGVYMGSIDYRVTYNEYAKTKQATARRVRAFLRPVPRKGKPARGDSR